MQQVYLCLTREHDLGLVALAVSILLVASLVGFDLLNRAVARKDRLRALWIIAASVVIGGGVWATHFIALLAYTTAPSGFEGGMALLSAGVGVVVSGVGLAMLVYAPPLAVWGLAAGVVIGGGIAAVHYLGMFGATLMAATMWDPSLVAASILLGGAIAALSGLAFVRLGKLRVAAAGLLLTLSVGVHHFVGMSAFTVDPALASQLHQGGTSRGWLAAGIAGVAMLVLLMCIAGAILDHLLTRRTVLEAKRLRTLVDATREGIVICRNGVICDANASFEKLMESRVDRLVGRRMADFAAAPDQPTLARCLAHGTDQPVEIALVPAGRPPIPVEILAQLGQDDRGAQAVIAVRDLRERRAVEAKIRFLAHHDTLTRLANRTFFQSRLEEDIDRAKREGSRLALFCIDLDRFKDANDTFGHQVGDAVLQEVARRLEALSRSSDLVARLGGDEFTILRGHLSSEQEAAELAAAIVQALGEPMRVLENEIRIGASVGIAITPDHAEDAETLMSMADIALYSVKSNGRHGYCMFEPTLGDNLRRTRTLKRDLQEAISNGGLSVVYQPQMDLDAGEVTGFEALVRWNHAEHGQLSPAEFIPLAEEAGLIGALGEFVLREACRSAAGWKEPLKIAVNLSPTQITTGDLPQQVLEILLETGLAPDRLELEITESVLIQDFERALAVLRRLKSLGVSVAMDDFGTGYSSLSYLQSFPFDKIKIDRSFIHNLKESGHAQTIVRAVLGIGRGLGIPVIAEGVETADQLDILRGDACDGVQGYFCGRPQPIDTYAHYTRGEPEPSAETAAAA